jgi:hypothetical protein
MTKGKTQFPRIARIRMCSDLPHRYPDPRWFFGSRSRRQEHFKLSYNDSDTYLLQMFLYAR